MMANKDNKVIVLNEMINPDQPSETPTFLWPHWPSSHCILWVLS